MVAILQAKEVAIVPAARCNSHRLLFRHVITCSPAFIINGFYGVIIKERHTVTLPLSQLLMEGTNSRPKEQFM